MNETVVTICTQCKALVILNRNTFLSSLSLVTKRNEFESGKIISGEDCTFKHYVKKLFLINQGTTMPQYPLCGKCYDLAMRHLNIDHKLTDIFNENLPNVIRFEDDKYFEHEKIEFTNNLILKLHKIHKRKYTNKCNPNSVIYMPMTNRITAHFYTFHISQCDYFGKINQQRVGTLDFKDISPDENNYGLFLIVRCLNFLCKYAGISVNSDLSDGKATIQGFHLQFGSTMLSRRSFNKSLDNFMQMSVAIFIALTFKGVEVPFEINLIKKTIGDSKWELESRNGYNFTLAMRRILVNMKTILIEGRHIFHK